MGCFSEPLTNKEFEDRKNFFGICSRCGVYSSLKQMADDKFNNRLYNENKKLAPLLKEKLMN